MIGLDASGIYQKEVFEMHHIVVDLTRIRKERHITQDALAKKIGVTPKRLSYWEKGKYAPCLFNLIAWTGALNLTMSLEGGKTRAYTYDAVKVLYRPGITMFLPWDGM